MMGPKIIGFTGTRLGMTPEQKAAVEEKLSGFICSEHGGDCELKAEAHHGDCVGADAEFHEICLRLGIPVVLHPCNLPNQRAFCQGALRVEPTLPPLERNSRIVELSHVIIGTPGEAAEQLRSGTWSTIRKARKRDDKVVHVFLPNGQRAPR